MYLDPIPGSGERILAGVVARLKNGSTSARLTLNRGTVHCVFGSDGNGLVDTSKHVILRALEHLEQHGTLEEWAPPYEGYEVGDTLTGMVDSADQFVDTEIMQGACFAMRQGQFDLPNEQEEPERATVLVRNYVVENRVLLRKHFNVKVSRAQKAKTTTIFYSGPRMVANIAQLTPGNMSYAEGYTKQKVFDLLSVRDGIFHQQEAETFKMLLLTPKFDEKDYSEKKRRAYRETLEVFEDIGDRENIQVKKLLTVEDAGNYILQNAPT